MKWLFIIPLLVVQVTASAQQLAAFNDNLNKFWIFDGGMFTQAEHLEVLKYQVGGPYVAYIDNGNSLKIYQNGKIEKLITGNPIEFTASDYLLGYSLYEQLNVWDNGKILNLSTQCMGYRVADSIIGWYDQITKNLRVYYNGITFTIEDGLVLDPLKDFKISSNLLVYHQPFARQLKLFYQGQIIILDDYVEHPVYEVGRNIVAFIDNSDNAFKAFYMGEVNEIEPFKPRSFKTGHESIAYVDNLGKLKLYYQGQLFDVSNYEPQFYDVIDNVFIYEEQGFFKAFCNGQSYVIERYIPNIYKIDWNTIAYLDQNNFIKVFQHCETSSLTYAVVRELQVIRDLVIFVEGLNQSKIYFLGQIFEHQF